MILVVILLWLGIGATTWGVAIETSTHQRLTIEDKFMLVASLFMGPLAAFAFVVAILVNRKDVR